ncbi:MaoC family dehydratase N-terminal domain-containing protein, partial [Gemmatimonadota bacterium]
EGGSHQQQIRVPEAVSKKAGVGKARRYLSTGPDIGRFSWSKVGAEKTRHYVVTAHDIRRFAQAIGETDPIDHDAAFLAPTSEGSLVAPLLFTQAFTFEDVDPSLLPADGSPVELDARIPASRAVGGGSEYEVFRPVVVGDELTVTTRLKDVYTRDGRSGPLFFVVVETEFHNQRDEPVARETATYIKRP